MRIIGTALLVVLLTLGACGSPEENLETQEGAAFVNGIWVTSDSPSGYVIRSAGTYSCGGYTYKMVATFRQNFNASTGQFWEQLGDSSSAIDGPVPGGQDVYLTCNLGPGGTAYGYLMTYNGDTQHLANTNGFYCNLKTRVGFTNLTTSIAIGGAYYSAYPYSQVPRGDLWLYL